MSPKFAKKRYPPPCGPAIYPPTESFGSTLVITERNHLLSHEISPSYQNLGPPQCPTHPYAEAVGEDI